MAYQMEEVEGEEDRQHHLAGEVVAEAAEEAFWMKLRLINVMLEFGRSRWQVRMGDCPARRWV
jgi:hypothetical protein